MAKSLKQLAMTAGVLLTLTACNSGQRVETEGVELEVEIPAPEEETQEEAATDEAKENTQPAPVAIEEEQPAPVAVDEEEPAQDAEVPGDIATLTEEETDAALTAAGGNDMEQSVRVTIVFAEGVSVDDGLRILSQEVLGGAEADLYRRDDAAREVNIAMTSEQFELLGDCSAVASFRAQLPQGTH